MGQKRQKREDKALGTSRPAERLARREKQANDAAKKEEERDAKAEEKVFEISLTRALVLRHKIALEKDIRTDKDIYEAVKEWREDPVAAERRYGHISDWDVSRVTDMSRLFYSLDDFNEDLSKWQTGSVTNMSSMFSYASSFTSDLSQWQTGKVTNMREMLDRSGIGFQERPHWYIG
jgi:surface protein